MALGRACRWAQSRRGASCRPGVTGSAPAQLLDDEAANGECRQTPHVQPQVLRRQAVARLAHQQAGGQFHQGDRGAFARAAMAAGRLAPALRDQVEHADRLREETLRHERLRVFPAAFVVVGAEEVQHDAAS